MRAMSLIRVEVACSSMRKMPTHMMILIGAIFGRHSEGLTSLYCSAYPVLERPP
jgi:hypothetical protein